MKLCGTKPDIATVGAYIPSGMNVGTISNDVVYPHMPSDENMLAGTYPADTTKGMVLENGVNIRTSHLIRSTVIYRAQRSRKQAPIQRTPQ